MDIVDEDEAMAARFCVSALLLLVFVPLAGVQAAGEAVNGFPNWNERVLLEWANRARSDPQVEMTSCGTRCGDDTCYNPMAPLLGNVNLVQAARFHAENMQKVGFFGHTSACTLVSNIAMVYPSSCDASASCACVGGTATCSPVCTTFDNRVTLFGGSASGESIAGGIGPDAAFYLLLFENYPTLMAPPNCHVDFGSPTNADRWSILMSTGALGAGQTENTNAVIDLGFGGTASKIPSGSHYPRQAASVDAWVNWYDTAAPSVSKIDVGGVCTNMDFARGTAQTNSAWTLTLSGVGSGCHRYLFAFKDSAGKDVLYPSEGSLAIGDGSAQCPDWSSAAPAGCAGFDRIFANAFEP